jgi:hypothetical protein
MMRGDDWDTQEALLDQFLLPLWPPVAALLAPELVDAPPEVRVLTLLTFTTIITKLTTPVNAW